MADRTFTLHSDMTAAGPQSEHENRPFGPAASNRLAVWEQPFPAIVIAASEELVGLDTRNGFGMGLRVFADSELLAALDVVMKDRPGLLVLSELFAATRRGAELIGRIKTDPTLSNCQIRALSDAGEYPHIIVNRVAAGLLSTTAVPGDPLSPGYNGTRQAQRVRIGDGLTVRIDGEPGDAD